MMLYVGKFMEIVVDSRKKKNNMVSYVLRVHEGEYGRKKLH